MHLVSYAPVLYIYMYGRQQECDMKQNCYIYAYICAPYV